MLVNSRYTIPIIFSLEDAGDSHCGSRGKSQQGCRVEEEEIIAGFFVIEVPFIITGMVMVAGNVFLSWVKRGTEKDMLKQRLRHVGVVIDGRIDNKVGFL